jgi:hypothetical protein
MAVEERGRNGECGCNREAAAGKAGGKFRNEEIIQIIIIYVLFFYGVLQMYFLRTKLFQKCQTSSPPRVHISTFAHFSRPFTLGLNFRTRMTALRPQQLPSNSTPKRDQTPFPK